MRAWRRKQLIIAAGAGAVLQDERVAEKLRRRPPPRRIPLQTASNKVPEIPRRRGRRLRRVGHTNGAHKGSPIALPAAVERKSPEVKFQDAYPEAPYIAGVAIVLAVIQIGVDPLGAHIGNRADRGIAIHGGGEDSRNSEIGNFHHTLRIDEEIGGFDIPNLDFAVVIRHVVAFHDARVADVTEDLDLPAHLEAHGVLVVAVDHFQGV
nr:hypothetical protein EUGRSUZ_F03995 [Ipomoea trifida]